MRSKAIVDPRQKPDDLQAFANCTSAVAGGEASRRLLPKSLGDLLIRPEGAPATNPTFTVPWSAEQEDRGYLVRGRTAMRRRSSMQNHCGRHRGATREDRGATECAAAPCAGSKRSPGGSSGRSELQGGQAFLTRASPARRSCRNAGTATSRPRSSSMTCIWCAPACIRRTPAPRRQCPPTKGLSAGACLPLTQDGLPAPLECLPRPCLSVHAYLLCRVAHARKA